MKAQASPPARVRIDSIDLIRGLVMVLMALDHARTFFTNAYFDPLDLRQTGPALFLTRWITHFCAPAFILLAGVSAHLMSRRMDRRTLSWFLFTRGLWLIFLEFTLVYFAWTFLPPGMGTPILGVLWAIGWCMIALAALIHLPAWPLAVLALGMIAGHNLLDGIDPARLGAFAPWWPIVHVKGLSPIGRVVYPLVPWIGVMAAGYLLGAVFGWDAARRKTSLIRLGIGMLALFLLLRLPNGYGDPQGWEPQSSIVFTTLAILNVSKYPPSLDFLLLMLGPALILLAGVEQVRGRMAGWLTTIGRVPMFFYVLHLLLAHVFAAIVVVALGFDIPAVIRSPEAAGWGFGLPVVYAVWVAVVVMLYPACRWFAALKARRRDWWLSYL